MGTWVIDRAAWAAGIDEVVSAPTAAVPAHDRGRGGAIAAEITDMLESDGLDGEVELLPNGTLRSRWTRRGRTERDDGSWSLIGPEIELTFAVDEENGGDEVRLRGPLIGDHMRLKPVLAADKREALAGSPPLAAAMGALTYPFVRR